MPTLSPQALRLACAAPALAFFAAFWLLPVLQLVALPAHKGWATYFAVLTEARYLKSLLQTLGLTLARQRFAGRGLLLSLLTLPLSFPGVIIGFFMILLGGRQGLVADLSEALGAGRLTLAYGLGGLFLAYLYFSLPRAIGSYTAAASAMDPALEEAARSLGAGRWALARDVWWPELAPTTVACGAMVFATAMGAFGTAFTLASQYEVLPITIYNEFTNYANFALAASLSLSLGAMTWGVLWLARRLGPEARNTPLAGA